MGWSSSYPAGTEVTATSSPLENVVPLATSLVNRRLGQMRDSAVLRHTEEREPLRGVRAIRGWIGTVTEGRCNGCTDITNTTTDFTEVTSNAIPTRRFTGVASHPRVSRGCRLVLWRSLLSLQPGLSVGVQYFWNARGVPVSIHGPLAQQLEINRMAVDGNTDHAGVPSRERRG